MRPTDLPTCTECIRRELARDAAPPTPEERAARLVCLVPVSDDDRTRIVCVSTHAGFIDAGHAPSIEAIRAAVAREIRAAEDVARAETREACAKIAEPSYPRPRRGSGPSENYYYESEIAAYDESVAIAQRIRNPVQKTR